MASQNDDFNKIKLYIQSDAGRQPLMISWNPAHPLKALIAEVCNQWNIKNPEAFALKFKSANQELYMTEENRKEIKSGDLLQLTSPPKIIAEELKQLLKQGTAVSKERAVTLLKPIIKDLYFVTSFLAIDGVHFLIETIQQDIISIPLSDQQITILDALLEAFHDVMEHSIVSWTIIQPEFIINLCEFLSKQKDPPIQAKVLSLLENALYNTENLYPIIFQSMAVDTIQSLIADKSHKVQLATLSFINAMLAKGNTKEYLMILKKQRLLPAIGSHLIGRHPQVKPEVAHKLYVCQNLTLSVLERRATSRFRDYHDSSYRDLTYLISQLNANTPDTASKNVENEFRKLGFLHEEPSEDFNEIPCGLLALDCMVYFAQSQPDNFTKLVLRKLEYQCPFAHTATSLTRMMYNLLKVGEPVSDISTDYIPMFFSCDNFFEDFFCTNIQLLFKTWKEMRATPVDFEKVMSVVQKQVDTVVRDQEVSSIDSYRRKIMQLNYSQILKQLDIEKEHQDANIFRAKPVMELKERLRPQIVDLIRTQRLNQMVKGESFTDLRKSKKNTIIFCKLTQNHKFLHFGEVEGNNIPNIEALQKRIQVNQMKELLTGKDVNVKAKSRTEGHALCIVYNDGEDRRLELSATDDRIFAIWCDGLRILLGLQPESELATNDLETLLNMDMKIHLLAIENIPIPDYPPTIPPDPPNLDFSCSDSDINS